MDQVQIKYIIVNYIKYKLNEVSLTTLMVKVNFNQAISLLTTSFVADIKFMLLIRMVKKFVLTTNTTMVKYTLLTQLMN